MLFIMSRPDGEAMKLVDLLAGDEDKELLLISDGVYMGRENGFSALSSHGFDEIYAEAKAVSDRGISLAPDCSAVSMEEIVDIIIDNEKVVNL